MNRHEVLWSTTYSDNGADHTLACDAEGCGWEIAITEATEAGAKRAAREHTELHATIKAKQENDERFMLERDEARQRVAKLEKILDCSDKDVAFLNTLYAAGVDNWEGYEIAQEMMEEESE